MDRLAACSTLRGTSDTDRPPRGKVDLHSWKPPRLLTACQIGRGVGVSAYILCMYIKFGWVEVGGAFWALFMYEGRFGWPTVSASSWLVGLGRMSSSVGAVRVTGYCPRSVDRLNRTLPLISSCTSKSQVGG